MIAGIADVNRISKGNGGLRGIHAFRYDDLRLVHESCRNVSKRFLAKNTSSDKIVHFERFVCPNYYSILSYDEIRKEVKTL